MYSLLWFLTVSLAWSTLALGRRGPRSYVLVVWVLSAAAGLLTHYFFAFVLSACLVWLVLHATKLSRLHIAGLMVVTALLVLPWYLQLPSNMGHWRVTKGWTNFPLTLEEKIINPVQLAWSYLSPAGVWGGSRRANILAAGVFALLIVLSLRQGVRFFTERPRLLWLIASAAVFGPYVLDLLHNSNISSVKRYALPGLPAAIMLVSLGLSKLSRRAYIASLILIPLIWLPAVGKVFNGASIYKDPFRQVDEDLAWVKPQDLIIVHSIPSGVLGVARYMETDTPIASWVVQLKLRRVPDDIQMFSSSYHRLALVKVHDLGYPSPAEVWLLRHKTLQHRDEFPESKAAVLYF
jgi:4-amino-4-deoxy-L-arabinose transferase-like glycosyltransferase